MRKGQDYDTPPSRIHVTKCPLTALKAYDPQDMDVRTSAYHSGVFSSNQRRLAALLQVQQNISTFVTKHQVRHLTPAREDKHGLIKGPTSIGMTEVAHLIHNIVEDPEAEFLGYCIDYEPDPMLTNSGISNGIGITQAVSIGDTLV